MSEPINTHDLICEIGKHAGERFTRIPVSYIKWLANTPNHRYHEIAKAELARRGTVTPTFDVSGHAIDRASLNCRHLWHATRGPEEGIHAWLCRMGQAALKEGVDIGEKKEYRGMLFVFETDGVWPTLKTVMPAKKKTLQQENDAAQAGTT